MTRPATFTWIDRPYLAAMARPTGVDELKWLRDHDLQLIISLTEAPLPRPWVNDAGLMALHIPVVDMAAPTQEQLDQAISAIQKARDQGIGVGVHCTAGHGRTGTVLAAYFVDRGLSARAAIAKVRALRPGSVETSEQEAAVGEFAARRDS